MSDRLEEIFKIHSGKWPADRRCRVSRSDLHLETKKVEVIKLAGEKETKGSA